jgi:hypothetical protein
MADNFYDQSNANDKTLFERCYEFYKPEDFVVVMNVDDRPISYLIQRPENVLINQPSAVTKELYYLKDPETITLQPQQTRLCPAYEANHMIKASIDQIVLRKRGVAIKEAQRKGMDDENVQDLLGAMEAVSDPQTQYKYIRLIFQGKRDFVSAYNDQINSENDQRQQATKDLGLDNDTPNTAEKPAGKAKTSVA